MKKSKIIVPALAMIGLSAVASITGSVAWFTAQRTATITAGEFGVVKTGDDLAVAIAAGAGTTKSSDTAVGIKTNYKLTDSSFDHTVTGTTGSNVVIPNVPREKVLSNVAINSTSVASVSDLETALARGTNTYSAFTWNMTFTVSFSGSSTKNQGLFLDLNDGDTYMHEAFVPANGEDVTSVYTDAKCTTQGTGTADGSTTYYRQAPDHSGKAFRIAFLPTGVASGSVGYAKIWADNETATTGEGKFIDGIAADAALGVGTAYATETVSYNGTTYSTVAAGSGKVLMRSGDNTTIPVDGSLNDADALAQNSNYLGYFASNPGNNVSLTFTCVAWYEGTHPEISGSTTDFEKIVASMKFGVCDLA